MGRAAALFTLLVAVLAAGAVLAQSVSVVQTVRARTVLGPEDLVVSEASVPGGIASIAEAVGREARVALYAGRPIMADELGAPALVERNQVVRMSYASGALRIMTEGRALDRAGQGEPVRVMNLASRQTVTGTVAADGSIEVGK